jgi:excisionase family DNA binding protein
VVKMAHGSIRAFLKMFYRVKQVAKLMQVSPKKVHRWIAEGNMRAINVGEPGRAPQWRIHEDDLRRVQIGSGITRRRRSLIDPDIDI